MKTKFIQFAFYSVAFASAAFSSLAQTVIFSDSFDRPDAPTVGNGWSSYSSNSQPFEISDGKAEFPYPDAFGGIARPLAFTAATTIKVSFSDISGFAGIPFRHSEAIAILSDGNLGDDGYRLSFYRGDANYNDSKISLFDAGVLVDTVNLPSSYQFGSVININATFALDGSITGMVFDGSNSFSFTFDSHAIQATGDYASFDVSGADSRSYAYHNPQIDDVEFSTAAVPEPATGPLLLGLAAAGAIGVRRTLGRYRSRLAEILLRANLRR